MKEIHSSNPPLVTGIFDPNTFQAEHHQFETWDNSRYMSTLTSVLTGGFRMCTCVWKLCLAK